MLRATIATALCCVAPAALAEPWRATVAVPAADGGNHISWRLLRSDKPGQRFAVLRDGRRIARVTVPSYHDTVGTATSRYTIQPESGRATEAITPWAKGYWAIPLDRPADRTTPSGERYSYTANDAAVADLTGDGRLEIILKWDPSISKDNAFSGYSGETLIDAYTLDGRRLWRIDLGRNIRSGAHYTSFIVGDFDGDGRAELMVRTADGTIDGQGTVIGDATADWRGKAGEVPQADRTGAHTTADGRRVARLEGRILTGPEYLSVFEGATGRALATAPYAPPRDPDTHSPTAEAMEASWGDGYANRSDRFLTGIATLDGTLPSAIFARGYYARSTVAAWDWRDGKLSLRWLFDSAKPGNEGFGGQGNHQMSVADVDGDGRDEIIYGSMALDDDGTGLWTARLGHGDALHVGDFIRSRPGLERFGVHEDMRASGNRGAVMLDARTGKILWSTPAERDTGRGLAADIDPRHPGAESWASNSPDLFDAYGRVIPGGRPRVANFALWWDGDALRELLDGNRITKWDWKAGREVPLLVAEGATSNNGTKATPALSGDILGDWREEVILRSTDNSELRIYTTPFPTRIALPWLMEDRQYAHALAWQNSSYNQPPHPSFAIEDPQ